MSYIRYGNATENIMYRYLEGEYTKLNVKTYRDKVYACWQGKNIGGTMGAPFEGVREKLNLTGFTTAAGKIIPNDDLDLQLAWLQAAEFEGCKKLTAEKLGEYWLSLVIPYWAEYGIAKMNMESGLYPSVSGDHANDWKHSNGAWIRTEIWATLAPACPDVALRYAMEDAKVDHGLGEGTYAAAFVAAIESAAFVISDVRKLIDIGLSKIPENSRMARTVRLILKAFDDGKTPDETRSMILEENSDIGDGWFQAPSNVGFVILGLLYGKGDFKKSMLYAINCGDDTDCTGATIGSIMGIIKGTAGIPEDWKNHIGDAIVTCSLDVTKGVRYPKSCTELTDRVVRLAPAMLIDNGVDVTFTELEQVLVGDQYEKFLGKTDPFVLWQDQPVVREVVNREPNSFSVDLYGVTAIVSYPDGADIKPGETKRIRLKFVNNLKSAGTGVKIVDVRLLTATEGATVNKDKFTVFVRSYSAPHPEWVSDPIDIEVTASEKFEEITEFVFELRIRGRYYRALAPVEFLNQDR